jgi:hypothetical protein
VKQWLIVLVGFLVLGAGSGSGQQVQAQPAPQRGVVWTPPSDLRQAIDDLRAMRAMGVQAVRTPLVPDERLLTLADSLDLQLYQDLPLEALPAAALRDTLAYATRVLRLALDQAQDHPSARHFGLARRSDTSDSTACAVFEQLADVVQEHGPSGSQTYYLSAFVEADRCASAVDVVLLDGRDAPQPVDLLARWRTAHGDLADAQVGLGALGTWVRPGAEGLRQAHSPERQARYLETHLTTLWPDTTRAGRDAAGRASIAFVYRWRDLDRDRPDPTRDPEDAYVQRYGLHTVGGTARPAREVVQGIFTGRQRVFAWPAGTSPVPRAPWIVVLGWGVILLLGLCYAFLPRFRYMVPRFFLAHGFYRESIREGRDVVPWASAVMLVAVALGVGVAGSAVVDVVRQEVAFRVLYRALPPGMQEVGVDLLAQPWMLALLLGCFHALILALWATLLAGVARHYYLLMPGQTMTLVVWPQWPVLVLMLVGMVLPSLPAATALQVILWLAGVAGLGFVYSIGRTLNDYARVTRVPGLQVFALVLASPLVVLTVIALFTALEMRPTLQFVWHLATRS